MTAPEWSTMIRRRRRPIRWPIEVKDESLWYVQPSFCRMQSFFAFSQKSKAEAKQRQKKYLARSIYRGCTCYLLDNIQPTSDPVFYCCFFDTQISLEISGKGDDDDSRGGAFFPNLCGHLFCNWPTLIAIYTLTSLLQHVLLQMMTMMKLAKWDHSDNDHNDNDDYGFD